MHALFISEVFSGGECHTRRCDTFDSRVICKIHKQHGTFDCTCATEIADEVFRFLKRDTNRAKHNRKLCIRTKHLGLTGDLRCKLSVRQTASREHGQFLTTNQGIEPINGRNACLDEFVWIVASRRIERFTIDIHALFRNQCRTIITRIAHTIKNATEHIHRHAEFNSMTKETCTGSINTKSVTAFKKLNKGFVVVYFEHFATAFFAVFLCNFDQFVVGNPFNTVHQHQRTNNFLNRAIFFQHFYSPPSSLMAAIWPFRSFSI